ncbi:MAG: NTP transferase domain-containing protein, partial [Hyphomicrobiales bacterium]|nr:NTP transferase domain-containing protein [Hyphomicrobiales bacterium]
MTTQSCLVIVLAAGEGTRMKSAIPKVLHAVGNRSMVAHVLDLARQIGADRCAAVIGPDAAAVRTKIHADDPETSVFVQKQRLGTAHAVLAAREALSTPADHVLVLYGDTPLMTAATLTRLREALDAGADVVVLGFEAADPTGYGRLIVNGDRLLAIREHRDASDAERAITFCNSGVLGFRGGLLPDLLDRIGNDNAKGEYYLTDAV